MTNKLPVLAILLGIAACSPNPTDNMPAAISSTGRIKVERIGVISDDLAYSNRRGVYLIRDTKTGAEFIGVSGVGISEVGSHQSGKVHVSDER